MKKLFTLLWITLLVFQSCNNRTEISTQISEEISDKHEIKPIPIIKNTKNTSIPTDEIVEEFYRAIFDKDSIKVRQMVGTTFPANYEPKNKIPPLQALIWTSDNLYLIKLFVENGADINKKGSFLVLVASEYGRLETLRYLVEKGCDIKHNDAFSKAGFHQFYDEARFLLLIGANQEKGDIRGKLWVFEQAVIKSDYEVLNKLNLTNGEINENNCNGETALIIAIKQNNPEMVKYLINKNTDKKKPETYDCGDEISYGKTPIQIARENDFQEIIALLE